MKNTQTKTADQIYNELMERYEALLAEAGPIFEAAIALNPNPEASASPRTPRKPHTEVPALSKRFGV